MRALFDLTLESLAKNGDGIGRLPSGQVIFIEGALPGDRVRFSLGPVYKGVQYGNLLEILAPAAEREIPVCQVERCGGCSIKGASLRLQARLKREAILQTLRRIGGITLSATDLQYTQLGEGWHYRHRLRLQAVYRVGGWRLGYFERHSRHLVPLSMCPVAWPEVEHLALELSRLLAPLSPEAALQTVEIVYSRRDGRGAARLVSGGPQHFLRDDMQWFERSGLGGVEIQAVDGRLCYGNLLLRYDHAQAEHFDLRYEPGLFTQVYPAMNDALVQAVLEVVRPLGAPRILELHAGIGNFSVPLARAGAAVTAVEQQRRAAIMCQRNGRAPGLQLEVVHAVDSDFANQLDHYDVVVIDPPRQGIKALAKVLAQGQIKRIVYIACDVATLARDAQLLLATAHYRLVELRAFEMFAQTPHVEVLAVFEAPHT